MDEVQRLLAPAGEPASAGVRAAFTGLRAQIEFLMQEGGLNARERAEASAFVERLRTLINMGDNSPLSLDELPLLEDSPANSPSDLPPPEELPTREAAPTAEAPTQAW